MVGGILLILLAAPLLLAYFLFGLAGELESPDAVKLNLAVHFHGKIREGVTHMAFRVDQKLPLTIKPVDINDRPAPVTLIKWEVVPAEAGTIAMSVDGLAAEFTPAVAGKAEIRVTANAYSGAPLAEALEIEVAPMDAVKLGLSAGEPTPQ